MDLRQLRYLSALARERHFARAAESCHVSQPTLSARIRQLEDELGVAIVRRGQRYEGLTPEGERVLAWARRIISDCDALIQEASAQVTELTGTLSIGVIPSALPIVPLITRTFRARYPGVFVRALSVSSIEIQRRLDDFDIDGGITYLDNEPLHQVRRLPLYREGYVLFTPAEGPLGERATASWTEAAEMPLCLLTPDMQNRRIIDEIFQGVGATPTPEIETNSMITLYAHVRSGRWSSVMPQAMVDVFGVPEGLSALPLVEPDLRHDIGLVTSDRDPPTPMARALLSICQSEDLREGLGAARLDRQGLSGNPE